MGVLLVAASDCSDATAAGTDVQPQADRTMEEWCKVSGMTFLLNRRNETSECSPVILGSFRSDFILVLSKNCLRLYNWALGRGISFANNTIGSCVLSCQYRLVEPDPKGVSR